MPVPLPSPVIGSIVCTPASAAVGESVCVEVLSPNGHRYDNTETSSITINGIAGSKHYLVWHRAGAKTIHVAAAARGQRQTMKAQVQITPPKDNQEPPLLMAYPVPHKPTAISFLVLNAPARVPPTPTGSPPGHHAPTIPPGPIRPRVAAAAAPRVAVAGAGTGDIDTLPSPGLPHFPAPGGVVLPPLDQIDIPGLGEVTQPVYGWNLGGVSMSSARPSLQHDFGNRLDPSRPYTIFHVTLTVQAPGVPVRVIRRSVSILNPWYQSRQRGILQPPVDECDLSLRHLGGQFTASFSVRNPEARDLRLTSMQLELMSSQGPRPFDPQPAIGRDLLLKGHASTRINVALANAQIPRDADMVALHYKGAAPDGMPVEVSVYFDVPQHASASRHVNPAAQALLTELGSSGLVANPCVITMHEVLSLAERGVLRAAEGGSPRRRLPDALEHALRRAPRKDAPPVAQALHVEPDAPVEGAECKPWNLPGNIPTGMQCIPTEKKVFMQMPARFINANKGDIVLNPGDGSLVSRILLSMSPPQGYSHSGIMTRNYDEITHSTASQERLVNPDYIDSDGFDPNALRYAWPGVITQTVDAAVNGEELADPVTGKKYKICDFGTLEGKMNPGGEGFQLVPAAVIKPLADTPDLRQTLNAIADFAAQQAGKSHYRFFCYTDPTLVDRDMAPASAGWAANTYPTVCSSFVWHAIRQAKVPMEGGVLEQKDLELGAQIVPSTPDGLYLYQEAERLAAAEMLFDKVHEMMLENTGWMGEAMTDAADDTANQILNAFASDWSDTDAKDSEQWRHPGDSYAVSPANLAFYDAPLYGAEMKTLLYRPARWEEVTIHVWQSVLHYGSVTGVVRYQGQPMDGARVELNQNNFVYTKDGGTFRLDDVPAGLALLQVSHGELAKEQSVIVPADQDIDTTVDLQPPSHLFRRVVIDGWQTTVDWEFGGAMHPSKTEPFYRVVQLSPSSSSHVSEKFKLPCDNAVGLLLLSFDLLDKDAIRVHTRMRCYHSDEAEGDDYVETQLKPFDVPAGHTHLRGIEARDGNRAYAEFTITNSTDHA